MTYREIEYLVYDGESRPFRTYYSSKWWAYKTYGSMCNAIDEYIKAKARLFEDDKFRIFKDRLNIIFESGPCYSCGSVFRTCEANNSSGASYQMHEAGWRIDSFALLCPDCLPAQ